MKNIIREASAKYVAPRRYIARDVRGRFVHRKQSNAWFYFYMSIGFISAIVVSSMFYALRSFALFCLTNGL